MSNKKYLLLSLDDDKTKHLADVLGNASCKKIIDLLAEKDQLSEKDIADELRVPMNTVEYNLKKLLKAELIEKSKKFFWSQKGKKIDTYTLSNKSIIISPKSQRVSSKLKAILPVAVISGIGALIIRQYFLAKETIRVAGDQSLKAFAESTPMATSINDLSQQTNLFSTSPQAWIWFLSGALLAILIFSILNWRKM